ncbi:MAG: NAD(P)/FAD-dependent oxidoreductase [Gammaproteobacteria bacterium]|nr:NAD(P)/FAD-dependent oxidoreductase [Gammaproteobacteria bacterium]
MRETVAIVGGGPAGTASAMNLSRLGFKPVIIESEKFPRFHIGESLTTECVDALNRLGLKEQLKGLAAPGKKGVRIFSKHSGNSFYVGAGDAWQVERARFDTMMLETAVDRGADYVQGRVRKLSYCQQQWQIEIELTDQKTSTLNAKFVIDASGQRRFSQRQGIFGPLKEGNYARQIAFFSQFKDVKRLPEDNFDTLIFHRDKHEWCWIIPLSESITSIGMVLSVKAFKKCRLPAEEFIDSRLNSFSDPLVERTSAASRIGKVRTTSNYSYRVDCYASQGLFCVGDSHRFIDPIFSFGVEFAVVEAEYVAKSIQACSKSLPSEWEAIAHQYMDISTSAQDVIEDMLSYFWDHPWGFANMAHVRYKEEFLEIFAGRIYEIEAGEGLRKIRASNARA